MILVNRCVANELTMFVHCEGCFRKPSERSKFSMGSLFYDVPIWSYKVRNLLDIGKEFVCDVTLRRSNLCTVPTWKN